MTLCHILPERRGWVNSTTTLSFFLASLLLSHVTLFFAFFSFPNISLFPPNSLYLLIIFLAHDLTRFFFLFRRSLQHSFSLPFSFISSPFLFLYLSNPFHFTSSPHNFLFDSPQIYEQFQAMRLFFFSQKLCCDNIQVSSKIPGRDADADTCTHARHLSLKAHPAAMCNQKKYTTAYPPSPLSLGMVLLGMKTSKAKKPPLPWKML